MASPKPADWMSTLADQLLVSAHRYGAEKRLVLPAAAVAVLLLGADARARRELLSRAAASRRPALVVRGLLGPVLVDCFPYLDGHLDALTGLLDGSQETTDKACRDMLAVLVAADLEAIVEHPQVGGDLLGALYSEVLLLATGPCVVGSTPRLLRGCWPRCPRSTLGRAWRTRVRGVVVW